MGSEGRIDDTNQAEEMANASNSHRAEAVSARERGDAELGEIMDKFAEKFEQYAQDRYQDKEEIKKSVEGMSEEAFSSTLSSARENAEHWNTTENRLLSELNQLFHRGKIETQDYEATRQEHEKALSQRMAANLRLEALEEVKAKREAAPESSS